MQIKFTGFKLPPFRNHVIVMVKGAYQKVNVGTVLDLDDKAAYEIMSVPDQVWTQVKTRTTVSEPTPTIAPRAILDGKAE